jgi:transposase
MATAKTTREPQGNHRPGCTLYLAFELGQAHWKLGFTTGMGQAPRERTITAGDLQAVEREIEGARRRFRLPPQVDLLSCYEAGRDGFWLHRFLEAIGHRSYVVDSSSIQVNRRARRAKSDALDLSGLLRLLIRYHGGERRVWRVVRVPTPEAEDARHLHRELMTLKRDRARVTNRMKGLLATQGLRIPLDAGFPEALEAALLWDGLPPLEGLAGRLQREWRRHRFLTEEIRASERRRRRLLKESDDPAVAQVRQLLALRGIGTNSAWLYVMEFFAWRELRNRREVGSLAGLAPTPYQSGSSHREQGIQKAGNRYIRAMAIEIAWSWLRHQPESELTIWYNQRFGPAGRRMRKVGIVALARKLLIALWRYLETGAIPDGAALVQA